MFTIWIRAVTVMAFAFNVGCNVQPNADADVTAAIRHFKNREFVEAIPLLERSLDKEFSVCSKSDALTMTGNCYSELDKLETALEFHERAIEADPGNYKALVNQGIVYRLMGEYDQAARCYDQALVLAPNYAELHASIGALAVFREDFDKAVAHLKRAVELDDSLAVAHSNLAFAYAALGRFEEADQELKRATLRGYHQPAVLKTRIDKLRELSVGK